MIPISQPKRKVSGASPGFVRISKGTNNEKTSNCRGHYRGRVFWRLPVVEGSDGDTEPISAFENNQPENTARQFELERPVIGADISFVPSQEDRGSEFSDHGEKANVIKSFLITNSTGFGCVSLLIQPPRKDTRVKAIVDWNRRWQWPSGSNRRA